MKIKMSQAVQYLMNLRKIPATTGKVGYSIYRNISLLESATKEFQKMQEDLILKYGENGEISQDSPNFDKYVEEIKVLLNLDCDVNMFLIDEDEMYNETLSSSDYLILHNIIVKH